MLNPDWSTEISGVPAVCKAQVMSYTHMWSPHMCISLTCACATYIHSPCVYQKQTNRSAVVIRRMWHLCTLVCICKTWSVHMQKWNVRRKMAYFNLFIAPMHSYVTNVFIYNLCITIFSNVCTCMLLLCYLYVSCLCSCITCVFNTCGVLVMISKPWLEHGGRA